MPSDGKQLEALVAFVENTLAPHGLTVKSNERVFNDEGVQVAEFDVEISGKFGSTEIHWLIECRDRPGQGKAPGSWIEQLVGRRVRFGFNKITAVSTTGFSEGAVEFARSQQIELREVASLSPEEFKSWVSIKEIGQISRLTDLLHADIRISDTEPDSIKKALEEYISTVASNEPILRSVKTGDRVRLAHAFHGAVVANGALFQDIMANGLSKRISLEVFYTIEDDYFVIDLPLGAVRVQSIIYVGDLRVEYSTYPLIGVSEYRDFNSKNPISQVATFEKQEILGSQYAFELHNLSDTNQTHVLLRKLDEKS